MTCVQTLWKRPASGAVWHALIVSIEQHVDRITGCICYMRDRGFEAMEAGPAAEEKWVAHVNEVEQKARTGRRFAAPGTVIAGAIQSRNAELDCFVAYAPRNDNPRSYMLIAVIPGRCGASSPESRDSGSGASHHPGMTGVLFRSPDE